MKKYSLKLPRIIILSIILLIALLVGYINEYGYQLDSIWYTLTVLGIAFINMILSFIFNWVDWWMEEVDILKIFHWKTKNNSKKH